MLGKNKWIWPKTRTSHPLSKLLRPLFEGKKPKKSFGIFLVVIAFLIGILVHPASAFETYPHEELVAIETEIEVSTQSGMKFPVKNSYISQGYWFLHPAIDLVAAKGTPVYPVMDGEVEKVEWSHFGYGHNVIINHGNKLESLYAHLSEIEVKQGEKVTQETVIGTVGSTGWATGNHLHLEIKENGKHLNPRSYLR
jgi:murein DD-endopeptidase MepM/ murein hydrolase activator NlpD